jgi:hypothetical protein
VSTLTVPQITLDNLLETLGKQGLDRPANVLFTEYLAALVLEEITDASTAERVGAVYHRFRFGAIDPDDGALEEVRSAVDRMIQKLDAMTAESRVQLADRLRKRLRSTLAVPLLEPAASGKRESERTFVSQREAVESNGDSSPLSDEGAKPFENNEPVPVPVPNLPARDRGRSWQFPKSPTAFMAIAAVGLFFAGFLVRGVLENRWREGDFQFLVRRRPVIEPDAVWRDDALWNGNVLKRAAFELSRKNDPGACQLYDVHLATHPHDASTLNELAWTLLTSKEIHNRQRGYELALRAVALSRSPEILDTAAEAHFQMGQFEKALNLEIDAIRALPASIPQKDYKIYSSQLDKFEAAWRSASSARTTVPSAAPSSAAPSSGVPSPDGTHSPPAKRPDGDSTIRRRPEVNLKRTNNSKTGSDAL